MVFGLFKKKDIEKKSLTKNEKINLGLKKSKEKIKTGLAKFTSGIKVDEKIIAELEDILIMADMGPSVAKEYANKISKLTLDYRVNNHDIENILIDIIKKDMQPYEGKIKFNDEKLSTILIVGVNGSGKTTTIGKMASQIMKKEKSVLLAAGDTFRAAAIEQLIIWGEKIKANVFSKEHGFDSAALIYQAIDYAQNKKNDVLIIDSAGRLQNKINLMDELKKINKVIKKKDQTYPTNTFIVLDATVGSNAIDQVREFNKCVKIDGIIMTKLDGSAKGGILINLTKIFKIPIIAIGVGEGINDLVPFNATTYANGIIR